MPPARARTWLKVRVAEKSPGSGKDRADAWTAGNTAITSKAASDRFIPFTLREVAAPRARLAAVRMRLGIVMTVAAEISIDVGQDDFEARVLEASRTVPVVVDFWADWCQPCRILSPVLDRLAEEYGGRFVLAKVDVDTNPAVAATFGIQGIPAVKAFRDGEVVAEFVGVQPEDVIRRFLDQVAPDVAALEPARKAEEAGQLEEAERLYREAASSNPSDDQATRGLARVLLARGAEQEARSLLAAMPADVESRRLLAELHLRDLVDEGETLAAAAMGALDGDHRDALDRLLQIIADGDQERDAARETMVAIFDLLGDEHPLTREYRPRLASALF
jgi:putative thioredoxin